MSCSVLFPVLWAAPLASLLYSLPSRCPLPLLHVCLCLPTERWLSSASAFRPLSPLVCLRLLRAAWPLSASAFRPMRRLGLGKKIRTYIDGPMHAGIYSPAHMTSTLCDIHTYILTASARSCGFTVCCPLSFVWQPCRLPQLSIAAAVSNTASVLPSILRAVIYVYLYDFGGPCPPRGSAPFLRRGTVCRKSTVP